MKHFYAFCMMAMIAIVSAFQAQASLSVTLQWETPGSVDVYVGSTAASAKAAVPADATEYQAVLNNTWGSTYIAAADGYVLESCTCNETSEAMALNYSKTHFIIDMEKYDGKTFTVVVRPIVNDSQITLNMVSGVGSQSTKKVTVELTGLKDTTLSLKPGVNVIGYDSSVYTQMSITIPFERVDGEPDYTDMYVKVNGEEQAWPTVGQWATSTSFTFALNNNDVYDIKGNKNDESSETVQECTVTPVYADAQAQEATVMAFNVTQRKTIAYSAPTAPFTVNVGDQIRLSFNTLDYVITINGEQLAATGNTTPWVTTITGDTTITIEAVERQYAEVTVYIAVDQPEGLEVRDGTINGKVIDLTALTPTDETFLDCDYKLYAITVGGKYSKAFVNAIDGWGILESVVGEKASSLLEQYSVTPADGTLHVKMHKIERSATAAFNIVLDSSATVDNLRMKRAHREDIALQAGWNTITFDPVWDVPMTISPVDVVMETDADLGKVKEPFSIYCDYKAMAYDDENNCYSVAAVDNSVLYAFVKRPNLTLRTLTFALEDGAEAPVVTYDQVKTFTPSADNSQIKVFNGTEVTLALADNTTVADYEDQVADGKLVVKATANETLTVKATTGIIVNAADAISSTMVVAIDGRVIYTNATAAQIEALAPGIYIINGQKMLKK